MRILIPALLALTFVGCSCQRQSQTDADAAPAPEQTATTASGPTAAQLRAQALERQRQQAYVEAVDVLHTYLQQLGSGKREEAGKHWAYQRQPRGNEESDLRALKNLRAVRIENETPKPLDQEPVPELLEIPVDLRVTLENGEGRRYKGWYRMRRNTVDRHWELTAVSIAVELK
ncbi:hypothetical protein [Lysobacter gummosus]|uniref:Lipoprotein n=1 Tax=Lysobacter gummosus TaxID=262324 RepID=A0ABY3XGR7_9GAMM|nr:hypothetical protein [Lysobacter gummosus]ALN90297.1 hypothetical protein LG3211_1321 [Lysobacter gummosus]UNP30838.1 hypothetical protein MOV92_06185 [Lysobacter gummosus]